MDFSPLTCQFSWCDVLLYMKYRNEPTIACQDVVHWIELFEMQVNTFDLQEFQTYFSVGSASSCWRISPRSDLSIISPAIG